MTNQATKERALTPQEVRAILNADNKEIVELCKQASILPKKNSKGKNLRKVQSMKNNFVSNAHIQTAELPAKSVPAAQPTAIQNILTSIQNMETNLSDKIAKVIDEKLEGMDEVVVELIRCKTDNETLRQKIVDLNKEVYQLKNRLNSYKPVALGFYVKKDQHTWE